MALLWDASLTDVGVSMISQWAQGAGDKLTITGAVIGEGVVAATQLHTLTQLTDQKSTISIQGSELVANGVKLKLRKTSQGITTSFILNQIGIYAKLDTSGGTPIIADSLIAVYQQDTGVLVPTEADSPDFVFTFYATVQTNYQGDLTINVDTSAILSQDDIADNLVTADATMALSANMGVKIADNLAANENVYGAKNLNSYPYYHGNRYTNGITFTDNGDGTITATGTASADALFAIHSRDITEPPIIEIPNGNYIFNGCPSGGNEGYGIRVFHSAKSTGTREDYGYDYGDGLSFTVDGGYYSDDYAVLGAHIIVKSGTALPVGGVTFKPMLRDARVIDDTFTPFAKTNKQLTDDKAERNDLSTIHATGSTNTTGTQIDAGTFFYLNGSFCKALQNIAANATFTLNTNFKVDTVGTELKNALDYSGNYVVEGIPFSSSYGNMYIPLSLPIPAKLRSLYSYSITDMSLGGGFASVPLTIVSGDGVGTNYEAVRITSSLVSYFNEPGALFNSLSALVSANASITVTVVVS